MRPGIRMGALASATALAALACNDPPTGPTPTNLEIIVAPSAVGVPGWELIDPIVVRAVDPSGAPRVGVAVTWTVREGAGSIAPMADTTDADGYARAKWTLGTATGVNRVRAGIDDGAQADFESAAEAFRADRIVSGWETACGLRDGALWCWGQGFWLRGVGVSTHNGHYPDPGSAPALVDASHQFVDLTLSRQAVCALDPQAAVWCIRAGDPAMFQVPGLPPIWRLAASPDRGTTSCGLASSDSTLWCWDIGAAATQVIDSLAFVGVWMEPAGPDSLGCGLLADFTAVCWGQAPLGDGTTSSSASPVVVAGTHRYVELAVGRNVACGRTGGGEVWCWGTPGVLVSSLIMTQALGIATEESLIQVHGLGEIWTWGTRADFGVIHEPVGGLDGLSVEGFAANNNRGCVMLSDRQVYCIRGMFTNASVSQDNPYIPVQPVPAAQ